MLPVGENVGGFSRPQGARRRPLDGDPARRGRHQGFRQGPPQPPAATAEIGLDQDRMEMLIGSGIGAHAVGTALWNSSQ